MARRGAFLDTLKERCTTTSTLSSSVVGPSEESRNNSKNEVTHYKTNWFCNRPLSPVPNKNIGDPSTDKNSTLFKNPVAILDNTLLKPASQICIDQIDVQKPSTSTRNSYLRTPSPFDDSDADPEFIPSSNGEDTDANSTNSPDNSVIRERVAVSPEIPNLAPIVCNELAIELPNNKSRNENAKRARQQDYCYFCESLVLNFARHIKRNHSRETEVERIFAQETKSKKRKELLTVLRKKGNYLANSKECSKPMKKTTNRSFTNYLPCIYCLGFYAPKHLWRHRKKCEQNPGTTQTQTQTDAQNHLLRHLRVNQQIREQVFPRMRADQISLVAKQDALICEFGARYMRIHREKHFINVTSRKMRELSRILIELRKLNPKIITLFDALQPQYFDLLVSATKIVAKYDHEKELFLSPAFAMNIATSFKQCCHIAIVYALKRKEVFSHVHAAEAEANLNTMIRLLEANWKFDISTQAADDLNMKKWNKITMVPLASDLKLLKEYLIKKATTALEHLQTNDTDEVAYTQLLETVFCRVLLLNRRRPGELERLPLRIYDTSESEADDKQKYQEFGEVVSPTEKILLNTFKRIVITGKRNRSVPVLFSLDVQAHIKILLKFRGHFIKKENPFLFGRPKFDTPISGYKVLQKHMKASGAKNPTAITSTKLRKHLATLTQLFNMTENDMEQLATFMGHTTGIHRKSYRLPDDVYQTAKISKLLLLMEKGGAAEYKGKALEDIEINLNEDLLEEDDSQNDNELEMLTENEMPSVDNSFDYTDNFGQSSTVSNVENDTNKCSKGKGPKRTLVPWTTAQKKLVESFFKTHIAKKRPPKGHECDTLVQQHPEIFSNKSWLKIKVYVQNKYTKH